MRNLLLIPLLAVALASTAFAADHDFTVSLVGPQESSGPQYAKQGVPLIAFPKSPSPPSIAEPFGPPSANSFYVVIRNRLPRQDVLVLDAYIWSHCLTMSITNESGRVYKLAVMDWAATANPPENWTFAPHGARVFAVDLTQSPNNPWAGLPADLSAAELARATVTFTYADGKTEAVTSPATEIYLCPVREKR